MFERYAIYYTFDGVLNALGAAWLGWDITTGTQVVHPKLGSIDLSEFTKRPRKYGFHATIKAPFYLAQNTKEADLHAAFKSLCASTPPAKVEGLEIKQHGHLFALLPQGDDGDIKTLAQNVVQTLNPLRAPLSPHDLKRRQNPRLSERQVENLRKWSYPHVMDDFRFHVTLTGPLKDSDIGLMQSATCAYFGPHLPAPFTISHLTLAGARRDGMFREINRMALTG